MFIVFGVLLKYLLVRFVFDIILREKSKRNANFKFKIKINSIYSLKNEVLSSIN